MARITVMWLQLVNYKVCKYEVSKCNLEKYSTFLKLHFLPENKAQRPTVECFRQLIFEVIFVSSSDT